MLVIVRMVQLTALGITTTFFPYIGVPGFWHIGTSKRLDVARRKGMGCLACNRPANNRSIDGGPPKRNPLFKPIEFWTPATKSNFLGCLRYQAEMHSFAIFICVLCLQACSIGARDAPNSGQTGRAAYV
jgi:hypothetical protein